MRTKQVGCIIYNGNSILLLRRIPSKGGFWQYVSGGVEEGEEFEDALYRELFEEIGIRKKDIKKIFKKTYDFKICYHYLTKTPITPIHEKVFMIQVDSDCKIDISNNVVLSSTSILLDIAFLIVVVTRSLYSSPGILIPNILGLLRIHLKSIEIASSR